MLIFIFISIWTNITGVLINATHLGQLCGNLERTQFLPSLSSLPLFVIVCLSVSLALPLKMFASEITIARTQTAHVQIDALGHCIPSPKMVSFAKR